MIVCFRCRITVFNNVGCGADLIHVWNREPGELRYPPPRIHTEEAFASDIYEYHKPSFRRAAKACITVVRSGFFTGGGNHVSVKGSL